MDLQQFKHELNNPLAFLLGNFDFLRQRLRGHADDDVLSALAEAYEGALRLRALVANFQVAQMPRRLKLADVVDATLLVARRELERRTRLTVQAVPDVDIHGDQLALVQLLHNLVINAIHAGAGSIKLSSTVTGQEAVLELADDGPGITPELLKHLGRGGSTKPGGGLGLGLCQQIARAHGGNMQIFSTHGRGTRVLVHLPTAEASHA